MRQVMVALIENQYFVGLLGFLLIIPPIIGIAIIHDNHGKGRSAADD